MPLFPTQVPVWIILRSSTTNCPVFFLGTCRSVDWSLAQVCYFRYQGVSLPSPQCSMPRCCPQCPRESTLSGLTRHRKTCKTYQQSIDASVRLAQHAEHTNSIARRTALQAGQQVVGVEEADSERMQTDITVSSAFIVLTHGSYLL
jgi:hypothetical protein